MEKTAVKDQRTEYLELEHASQFFTANNRFNKMIEQFFQVEIEYQKDRVAVSGSDDSIRQVQSVLTNLSGYLERGDDLDPQAVLYFCELAKTGRLESFFAATEEVVLVTGKGRSIRGKTLGQQLYIDALKHNELVFCIGPAGTGKTFLGVAMAVAALRKREVSRIILARPAVEAGERLGFLPGDIKEKVDPYMRPLYDALQELLGEDMFWKLSEKGLIEVSPLAFMRGRTLDDAFILLDEAQNTTVEQMKMFLTRTGMNARVCVCGDITQIDLPKGVVSGLWDASSLLHDIPGIGMIQLSDTDVVRNPLVQKIIQAYNARAEKGGSL